MKSGKVFGYTLGAICILIAIYFSAWSILNPDYAAEYPFIALILFVIGITIILCNVFDRRKTQESQPTQITIEEYMESLKEDFQEPKFNPEEKIFVNGIDVNKLPYKSKTVAIVLCLFLGLLGIHRIYLGHITSGIIMLMITLFFWWTYVVPIALCIFCLIDIFKIANGDLMDCYNRPLI